MLFAFLAAATSPVAVPSAVQPAVVWVDDDFDASTPGWQIDHFDTVQSAISAVATGGTVNVLEGTYDEALYVARSMSILGADPSLVRIDATSANPTITIVATGVTLSGLTLSSSAVPAQRIVRAFLGEHTLTGNVFDILGEGLRFDGAAHGNLISANTFEGVENGQEESALRVSSDHNTIDGNTFASRDGSTLHFIGGDDNRITNNVVDGDGAWEIHLSVCDDTTITGNTIRGTNDLGHAQGSVVSIGGCNRTTIEDNSFSVAGGDDSSISLDLSPDTVMRSNQVGVEGALRITVTRCDRILVEQNAIAADSNGRALRIEFTEEARVLSNTFSGGGVTLWGFLLEHYRNHTISGNTVAGAPIRYYSDLTGPFAVPTDTGQVLLANCEGVTVSGLFLDRVDHGVTLAYSDGNTIEDVVFGDCLVGVDLFDSDDNTLRRNHVSSATLRGFELNFSGGNAATENVFSAGDYSVFASGVCASAPNSFVHNAFVDTLLIDNCGNVWDAGHPTGGNYYDTYAGADGNGDGIGDVPYTIDGNQFAKDLFPLMAPRPRGVLTSDQTAISASGFVLHPMDLDAGAPNAGRPYLLLAGASGFSPGTTIPGSPTLPLNVDAVTLLVLESIGSPLFANFAANLGGDGTRSALLQLAPLGPGAVGLELVFAYVLTDALDYVSAPLRTPIVP